MSDFFTVEWQDGAVVMLDQRLLTTKDVDCTYRDYRGVAKSIKEMVVRGAPAIGVAAAMGIALGAHQLKKINEANEFARLCQVFAATRPTAVNLFWAIERMQRVYQRIVKQGVDTIRETL